MDVQRGMDRGRFLKVSAAGAAGLEAILAARRAPAFTQGATLKYSKNQKPSKESTPRRQHTWRDQNTK